MLIEGFDIDFYLKMYPKSHKFFKSKGIDGLKNFHYLSRDKNYKTYEEYLARQSNDQQILNINKNQSNDLKKEINKNQTDDLKKEINNEIINDIINKLDIKDINKKLDKIIDAIINEKINEIINKRINEIVKEKNNIIDDNLNIITENNDTDNLNEITNEVTNEVTNEDSNENSNMEDKLNSDIESINVVKDNNDNLNVISENDFKFNEKVLIYYSKTSYNLLFQRPHQIMRHFDKSYSKIFITCDDIAKYEEKYNLLIVPYKLKDIIINLIKDKEIYIYYTDSRLYDEVKNIKCNKVLFDLIDAPIDEFIVWKPKLADSVNNADVIMYSHPKLVEFLNEINPEKEYHYVSNGCDYEHFSKAKERIYPKPKDIPETDKPILGYYGAFSEWLDYDLIRKYADENEYHILMIGGITNNPSYNRRFEHPNIIWLDHKSYDELPVYLSWFDKCLIPFKECELTKYVNPCKLWEYMASDKLIYSFINLNILFSFVSTDYHIVKNNNLKFNINNYNNISSKIFDYKIICIFLQSIIEYQIINFCDDYKYAIKYYNIDSKHNIYDKLEFYDKNKISIVHENYYPYNFNISYLPITIIFMLCDESIEEIKHILNLKYIDIVSEILIYVCKNNDSINNINSFAINNDKIKIFYFDDKKNYSDGRNILINDAKNEIILSLDVGNIYPETYLIDMFQTYINNNKPDMVCSICSNVWVIDDYNKGFFYPSSKNILFKKSISQEIGLYPSKIAKFGEDTLFDLYYFKKANNIIFNKNIDVKWICTNKKQTELNYIFGNYNIGLFFKYPTYNLYYYQAIYHKLQHYLTNNKNNNKIIIINSLVSLDDQCGGQRCTKLAKSFIDNGYYVVFNTIFPNLEKSSNRTYIDLDPFLFSYFYLYNINYNIFDLFVNFDVYIINEAPYPILIDICQYIKSKNKNTKIIYDIIDNWDSELGWFWYNKKYENWFLENSDKIISSSREFINKYNNYNIEYISNGVDEFIFNNNNKYIKPFDMPNNKNKNIIYFGTINASWFDDELILEISNIENINIILIGSYTDEIKNKFNKVNIFLLGKKNNTELPKYLYYSDITIIPFKINDIINFTNPLKIYEYLAMKKPVVLTDMKEVYNFNNVFKCKSNNEFIFKIKELIKIDYKFIDELELCKYYYSNLIKKIL